MTTRQFGASVARVEDPRLLRGEGRYLDDLGHDALAVAMVRSPHAHARILDVDVTDAIEVDGLVAIYTFEDLPERLQQPLPLLIPHPSLTAPVTQYALANGEVNHVGEAIVMVVATDRYVAEDVVGRIRVDYEVRDAVVDIESAVTGGPDVHDAVSGNVAAELTQTIGDAEQALSSAPHRLRLRLDIERSASTPLEGRGVHARWDADDASLRVHTSTQAPTSVRAAIATFLELDFAQVEVVVPDVGGGFGVKIMHPWPEELLVPWAARLLGREVKFTEDRHEHFVSANHERGQVQHVEVGFDDEGRILGLDVDFLHDHGAYIPYGLIVPIITSTQLLGPYRIEHYRVRFRSVYTNKTPVSPYRGAGRPQGCFLMERTVDAIAAELGLDRALVRERNFIQPDEMPYAFGLTFQDGRDYTYDSGDFPASLDKLRTLVDWDGFAQRKAAAAAEGRLLGIGLACYVEGTGVGPYEGGHVLIEPNGTVQVATGLGTQGQGHQTVFGQIVADELGVPLEHVRVVTGDTRRFGYAVGTFASRAAVMSGNAVHLAATKVREKALQLASDALEVDVEDLELADGRVQVVGSPGTGLPLSMLSTLSNPLRYAFDEHAKAATQFAGPSDPDRPPVAEGQQPGLEGTDYYSPVRSTFANGMHAVEVEVDPATSDISILRYAVVHDCGNLINPKIVQGQVLGGVAQGVGGALYERMAYDEHGQLLNASFMDFLMPYATEVPTVEIDHLETPSPLNPLGIKGAGEAGVIPGSAAIAAAIEDATGVPVRAMPISPSQLHELRQTAGGAA
ncbi:aerobic carbon-monoxide dehydrogenase large subunit [Egicoccus halophilus]|uniref:Dehydrogenase n=1 Tax=Egicoccus halophilus TaxID=1670830 RepID=A0A8J3ETN2_9ACTN|nr:aerobic carbon-monoxide dehydrogenase large subunit [Egicoccus halophilus]GGI04260.1 dehydrogenase [Egicoccus halophilus]